MERIALQKLIDWNNNKRKKPLIVWGARQVGKTYLVEEIFAKKYYKNNYIYIDCKKEDEICEFCSKTANAEKIIEYISLRKGKQINEKTLLIFDEVQQCPNIISSLKYFCQDYREILVIATGSMVRIKLQRETHKRGSRENDKFLFPVGKINQITIYPMTFDEFLMNSNKMLYDAIKKAYESKQPLDNQIHELAMEQIYKYLLVGGMPEAVEAYIDGNLEIFGQKWSEIPFAKKEKIGRTVDYVAGRNRYIGYLISLGMYSFRGIKVGLDCANGSSWNIAKAVFEALGATTYVINAEPSGFNINMNAGSTHIEGLQKFVVENGLDVGFAYDGDADRCLCVDEKGNVLTGDHILYICAKYMKERGTLLNNTVVTTVMSNFGLYKAFDELGINYAKTAVGDKYVYEYMMKNNNRIGGEQSGHIIFSKYASTGDGILTSLKMMEVMLAKEQPLSKLAEPLVIFPQVLTNVRVSDKAAAQNDPDVKAAVEKAADALGDSGRILVRESGTEPVVRVMVEASSEELCRKYVESVVDVIKEKGYCN